MKIVRSNSDLNFIVNTETNFFSDLGSEENLQQFEGEILNEVINPLENYETIRFIHKPYTGITSNIGDTQCDIWFYFYFLSGGTYIQDYSPVDITPQENELLLRQATDSFFRLEFYKTPISGNTYEPPTRTNRKLVFTKNLSIPLGEKFYYSTLNGYIHIPIFTGSNYRNKENMYLFWFEDESVLSETNLSGTTTGNTFFMTAKFYNAKDGSILDFTNSGFSTNHIVSEQNDMYYQVDIDKFNHTYEIFKYTGGTTTNRFGVVNGNTINPIKFYEKGGGNVSLPPTTPTTTPSPTPTPSNAPSYVTPTTTPTTTPTPSPVYYWYELTRCDDGTTKCYSVPKTSGAMMPGRIFHSAGDHYYVIGSYFNTTGADPGVGSCSNKLDGSMMPVGYTCYDSPETPIPTVHYRTESFTAFYWSGVTTPYNSSTATNMCGKSPYQFNFNIQRILYLAYDQNGLGLVSGTTYSVYTSNIDGTGVWNTQNPDGSYGGGDRYWGIIDSGNTVQYIVKISTGGSITEWYSNCP
jgi:hypothetical protein